LERSSRWKDGESLGTGFGTVAFVGLTHTLSLRIGDALDA
jgi:hypothetical protein